MTNELPQAQQIAAAREILQPNPVIKGKYPVWLRKILDKEYATFSLSSVLSNLANETITCIDHWGISAGYYSGDPEYCFVAEPYGIGHKELAVIEKFCKKHNLKWYVSSNSWHFPGKTIRLVIRPKKEKV